MVADLDRLFHTLDGKPAPSHLADAANIVNRASYDRARRPKARRLNLVFFSSAPLFSGEQMATPATWSPTSIGCSTPSTGNQPPVIWLTRRIS
jgi:hypothetical protein